MFFIKMRPLYLFFLKKIYMFADQCHVVSLSCTTFHAYPVYLKKYFSS